MFGKRDSIESFILQRAAHAARHPTLHATTMPKSNDSKPKPEPTAEQWKDIQETLQAIREAREALGRPIKPRLQRALDNSKSASSPDDPCLLYTSDAADEL